MSGPQTTNDIIMKQHHRRFAITAALALLLLASAQARTWTSADGKNTIDGELHSYDPVTGKVVVMLPNHKSTAFQQDKLSADDIAFLKENGAKLAEGPSANKSMIGKLETDPKKLFKKHFVCLAPMVCWLFLMVIILQQLWQTESLIHFRPVLMLRCRQ